MAKFLAIVGILVWTSCGIALACPVATAPAPPALAPLLVSSAVGGQLYYCMPSSQISKIGDLSPSEWAKQVQICNTSCSYEPMIPGDSHSLLIPTSCGPGLHDLEYQVQPPAAPKAQPGTLTLKMVTAGCTQVQPAKGPPALAPASLPSA
ncbi:MAG TPA: hypothetical protein VJP85_13655 [Candidatus Baltobacteraceae bacterium]|nr:hypothetical protein [Candidatus Baltobacteraceae bacterium]